MSEFDDKLTFKDWEDDGGDGFYSFKCSCGEYLNLGNWKLSHDNACDGCRRLYTPRDLGVAINAAVRREEG